MSRSTTNPCTTDFVVACVHVLYKLFLYTINFKLYNNLNISLCLTLSSNRLIAINRIMYTCVYAYHKFGHHKFSFAARTHLLYSGITKRQGNFLQNYKINCCLSPLHAKLSHFKIFIKWFKRLYWAIEGFQVQSTLP